MRPRAALAVFLLSATAAPLAAVQLTFEVASVKPASPSPNGVSGGCHGIDSVYTPGEKPEAAPLGRCVISNARLAHLVSIAWKIDVMALIESGPEWIQRGGERFNVAAKAEDPSRATEQQLLTMLQNMIVDRFQMKFHREPKETQGFGLIVDKNGPHLDPSKSEDADLTFSNHQGKPSPGAPVSLKAKHYSMAMLVQFLSTFGGKGPGIDRTGLSGFYDFTLAWDDDAGPILPGALREQLGLRMESQKVEISNFVIDSAQRPSAN
ncbi:MAG TPA: TIGR03435 family protein [Bryobacteraceae bacterium]|jgi:uncharacterized protein (TIGR03435 family)|nr:TIGR03435 family protein [Bryobacteraceae bacterium]